MGHKMKNVSCPYLIRTDYHGNYYKCRLTRHTCDLVTGKKCPSYPVDKEEKEETNG